MSSFIHGSFVHSFTHLWIWIWIWRWLQELLHGCVGSGAYRTITVCGSIPLWIWHTVIPRGNLRVGLGLILLLVCLGSGTKPVNQNSTTSTLFKPFSPAFHPLHCTEIGLLRVTNDLSVDAGGLFILILLDLLNFCFFDILPFFDWYFWPDQYLICVSPFRYSDITSWPAVITNPLLPQHKVPLKDPSLVCFFSRYTPSHSCKIPGLCTVDDVIFISVHQDAPQLVLPPRYIL